ncbi:hypothetical protein B0H17DRAFT_1193411 [Mycena rosella]|uniref:Uncharacterized protein n=1 Tax=Mycena rosella TaxID=1033263 RepID=A0AAD7GTC6_MYCRO|nr:hypothetical protein B0H17DRAFT_1193411 [Mycena rosella]
MYTLESIRPHILDFPVAPAVRDAHAQWWSQLCLASGPSKHADKWALLWAAARPTEYSQLACARAEGESAVRMDQVEAPESVVSSPPLVQDPFHILFPLPHAAIPDAGITDGERAPKLKAAQAMVELFCGDNEDARKGEVVGDIEKKGDIVEPAKDKGEGREYIPQLVATPASPPPHSLPLLQGGNPFLFCVPVPPYAAVPDERESDIGTLHWRAAEVAGQQGQGERRRRRNSTSYRRRAASSVGERRKRPSSCAFCNHGQISRQDPRSSSLTVHPHCSPSFLPHPPLPMHACAISRVSRYGNDSSIFLSYLTDRVSNPAPTLRLQPASLPPSLLTTALDAGPPRSLPPLRSGYIRPVIRFRASCPRLSPVHGFLLAHRPPVRASALAPPRRCDTPPPPTSGLFDETPIPFILLGSHTPPSRPSASPSAKFPFPICA